MNDFVSKHAIHVEPPIVDPPKTDVTIVDESEPTTLEAQRARLFDRMRADLGLSNEQLQRVQAIFSASPHLGQGNPALSKHPISRAECHRIRREASITRTNSPACNATGMVAIFDPSSGQTDDDAHLCMDELEFPNIPCEYPVVHVRASEAAALCSAIGKRICDAHEWEGACAGAFRSADVEYQWGRPRAEVQTYHNHVRDVVWSYGPKKNHAACGLQSFRSPDCPGGGYEKCGSNTYPTGAFPQCRSALGVFDMHGNVAEHMNLPTIPSELGKNGGSGFTEMKGSWFAFGTQYPHSDDCRWRAPAWHETRLSSESSHYNYHLGFRCCKDI
ncbi:MAG: SUMF1/EgtB/PvdO family nonheme iron enzyme [Polyangiaceae bacterium]|nr:SUMF1/EgtB/PvdO family nonheme iron enzyme [Polyangiaceae bacterium]